MTGARRWSLLALVLLVGAGALRRPLRRAVVRWTGTEIGQVRAGSRMPA